MSTPRAIGEEIWIENGAGAARAHRVVRVGPVHLAPIGESRRRAVLIQSVERAGDPTRLVPVSELTAAAPLSAAEEAEFHRLDRELAGTKGEAGRLSRFNALRLRSLIYDPAPRPAAGWELLTVHPPCQYFAGGAA